MSVAKYLQIKDWKDFVQILSSAGLTFIIFNNWLQFWEVFRENPALSFFVMIILFAVILTAVKGFRGKR